MPKLNLLEPIALTVDLPKYGLGTSHGLGKGTVVAIGILAPSTVAQLLLLPGQINVSS